jgi:steroid delta-isomerase-like uncharacterized protein
MSEQNKELVRRLIDAFDRHDFDALDELVAADFRWHGGSFGEIQGLDSFKQLAGAFFTAFPDLRLELHDVIADGDRVATRFTSSGTHEAELSGVPATGKHVRWEEQPIYRIEGGTVVEVWWVADIFGLMQQLGAIPSDQEVSV